MAVIKNEDLETMEKVSKILYNTICYQNVENNEYYKQHFFHVSPSNVFSRVCSSGIAA